MSATLTLLCCGATATGRRGGFVSPDEPLDAPGLARAARVRRGGPMPRSVVVSPVLAARQTAAASGLNAAIAAVLSDCDWGAWAGMSIEEVHAIAPDSLARWLVDPAGGAPGGESLTAVRRRVEPWLAGVAASTGRTMAVTHPMVIRAILGMALGMADAVAMRIDIAPLSTAELSFQRGWRLQELRRD